MVTDSEGYIHIIQYLTEHLSLFENAAPANATSDTVMSEIEEQLSEQIISVCSQNDDLTFNQRNTIIREVDSIVYDLEEILSTVINNPVSDKQKEFLLSEISLSFLMMLVVYAFIAFGIRLWFYKSTKTAIYVLIIVVVIQSLYLIEKHQKKTKKEFIVFHKSRNTIIGKRIGENLFVYHDLDAVSILKASALASYKVAEDVKSIDNIGVKNLYQFKNETILIVDSLGVYQLNNLIKPIVLLQQSPKINLERMIKTIAPKQIIADGSNYKSYIKRWKKTCVQQKTPFHYTGTNGAFKY